MLTIIAVCLCATAFTVFGDQHEHLRVAHLRDVVWSGHHVQWTLPYGNDDLNLRCVPLTPVAMPDQAHLRYAHDTQFVRSRIQWHAVHLHPVHDSRGAAERVFAVCSSQSFAPQPVHWKCLVRCSSPPNAVIVEDGSRQIQLVRLCDAPASVDQPTLGPSMVCVESHSQLPLLANAIPLHGRDVADTSVRDASCEPPFIVSQGTGWKSGPWNGDIGMCCCGY